MEKNSVRECILQLRSLLRLELQVNAVVPILQRLTVLMQSSETRDDLKSDLWDVITKLAERGLQIICKDDFLADELQLLACLLRFLRNSCGGSFENQHFVLNTAPVFHFAQESLQCFLHKKKPNEVLILKISIQLFGNILSCNSNSKPVIWNIFFKENKFRLLFAHEDDSIKECTMMVLYNCMSEENCKYLINTKEGHHILICVTDLMLKSQIEWNMTVIEYLLKNHSLLDCYLDLPSINRCFLIDMMTEYLKEPEVDSSYNVPIVSLENVKNLFVKHITNIKDSKLEPAEILAMLSLLCEASVKDFYMPLLQSSKDLLQTCVESLKLVHILGKQGCTDFSKLSNLKEVNSQFNETNLPYSGFKGNLIRLIGNLSYKCKENQDLVRNLDGIPFILDSSGLDARNLFINEWCILAIRNLLENNLENQAIVAGISAPEDVIECEFLNDMGVQVQKEDGKISIMSKKSAS